MSNNPAPPANSAERIFAVALCVASLIGLAFAGSMILNYYQSQQAGTDAGTTSPAGSFTIGAPPPVGDGLFELDNATIPRDEIFPGGPPKDGIPAITDPKLIPASEADYLSDSDRIIGVTFDGVARAYPLSILGQHEIVNDTVANQPVAVTYCPLCDSALAFDRPAGGRLREFGVSGLLYGNNVLMYDRGERESLWSQMMQRGVAGAAVDTRLELLPLELTTWGNWTSRYPDTKVLSPETGFSRDYQRQPYRAYFATDELMFPMKVHSDKLPNKTPVLGVIAGNISRAYPVTAFSESHRVVTDQLDTQGVEIAFDPDSKSLRVVRADPDVRWAYAFWFAWYGFHPETEIYQP